MKYPLYALVALICLQACSIDSSDDLDTIAARGLAAGDLDQDGAVDIVGLESNINADKNGHSLFLLPQIASNPGTFAALVTVAGGIDTFAIGIGDLDHDGINDIALFGDRGEASILFQDPLEAGLFA